jgi:hypothetical protein
METVPRRFTNMEAYGENFQFRDLHINRSNSVKIMLYAKYMIVNKTESDIICKDQVIKSQSNDYLMQNLSK